MLPVLPILSACSPTNVVLDLGVPQNDADTDVRYPRSCAEVYEPDTLQEVRLKGSWSPKAAIVPWSGRTEG